MMPINPKIYHILHVDKLQSIINSGGLFSDAEVIIQGLGGTTIGMNTIKQRRLNELTLETYPTLYVGQCVPFYFCPRSVMLYMMHMNNPELTYQGGQDSIIHLEIDFYEAIQWADDNNKRWAFTDSNAGSNYFSDTSDITNINVLDWDIINSNYWSSSIDKKQAEFLCEDRFPWELVGRIGVNTEGTYRQVQTVLQSSNVEKRLEIIESWYY
jgi:hypothetical protein